MHQSMKLHMHVGRETSLGLKLNVSLEALAVELGVSSQPLQQCYAKYKNRVMWCWLVSLWEKCSMLDIEYWRYLYPGHGEGLAPFRHGRRAIRKRPIGEDLTPHD